MNERYFKRHQNAYGSGPLPAWIQHCKIFHRLLTDTDVFENGCK